MAMDKEYSFIQELNMSSNEWKLKIRVLRVWDVFNLYDKNNSFVGVDMLFIDEKGDQIHGSMKPDIFRSIGGMIQEGAILKLENFRVENKSKSFRPVSYEYKITFDNNAIIEPAETEITFPQQKFCFLDFKRIPSKFNENGDLPDVIGFWDTTKYETKDTTTSIGSLRNMHINDNDGNAVRIAFWDEMIKQIPELTSDMDQQVVIIVTSISVKKFQCEYYLQATFASKVYVNFEHPEVASFKSRGMKPSQRLVVTPTRTPKRSRLNFEKDIVDAKKTVNEVMSAIMDVASKDYQSCTATITKVHKDRGWYYISCKTCFRIVKSRGNKQYWCAHCDDNVECIERLKVQLEIDDGTAAMDITVFADIAENLIGCSFDSLIQMQEDQDDEPVFEEIERNVIAKKCDFTLRISAYNRKNPTSSLTATTIERSAATIEKGKQIKTSD